MSLLILLCLACTSQKTLQDRNCNEPFKWKFEDYTKVPFFANQIFTKGFGVYILLQCDTGLQKSLHDSISNSILNGFRVALTNWGVSLLMNKNKLHFELKNYLIDNSFKHGDNFTYNAPQVFEVKCMQNANFVVQVYLKNGKKFRDSKSILAKAQIQGRTIILNLQTQNIVYEQKLFEVYSSSGAYNIVPVLAHELGHCFGLRHDTSGISIMAATTKSIAKFPTSNDGLKFAQTLAMKIQGSQPGYFNPTHCIGLRSN